MTNRKPSFARAHDFPAFNLAWRRFHGFYAGHDWLAALLMRTLIDRCHSKSFCFLGERRMPLQSLHAKVVHAVLPGPSKLRLNFFGRLMLIDDVVVNVFLFNGSYLHISSFTTFFF